MRTPRSRRFVETTQMYGSSWRRVAVITCCQCGVSDTIGTKHSQSHLPLEVINRKFTQRGWEIGANELWDVCPKCAAAAATNKKPQPQKPLP